MNSIQVQSVSFYVQKEEVLLSTEILEMVLGGLNAKDLQKMRLVNSFFNRFVLEYIKKNVFFDADRLIKKILIEESNKKNERMPLNKRRVVKKIGTTIRLVGKKYSRIPLEQVRLSDLFFELQAEYAFSLNKVIHSRIDQDPFFQFNARGFLHPTHPIVTSFFSLLNTTHQNSFSYPLFSRFLEEVDTLRVLFKDEVVDLENSDDEFEEHVQEIGDLENPLEKRIQQIIVGDYWLDLARYQKAYTIFQSIENEVIKSLKLYTLGISFISSLNFQECWSIFEQITSEHLKKDLINMVQLYHSCTSIEDKCSFFSLCEKKIEFCNSQVDNMNENLEPTLFRM